MTHGICPECAETVVAGTYNSPPKVLIAQKLFHAINQSHASGEFTLPEALFREAIDAQIRASDLMLGVLQPALYRIGLQWERGEVTPALEQAFSTWCGSILSRFPAEFSPDDSPTIILTPLFSNFHVLGIAILAALLREHHVPCLVIVPGLPDDELVAKCVHLRPAFCGISVSLPTRIGHAVTLANRIHSATDGHTRAILGGFAFRKGVTVESGIAVFEDMSTLLRLLKAA